MSAPTRSLLLRVAVMAALVSISGCATFAKWKQERHEASLRREQTQDATDRADADSKARRAARAEQEKEDARLRRLQTELAARGDPDSLAASALFERVLSGFTSSSSLELAARAVAGAPQRADLAFLQLQLCQSAPPCDTAPLEARLQRLDPQNGIPWTYALLRADSARNAVAGNAALDGLAASTRVDLYWNKTVSTLTAAASGHAGFDASAAMIEVIGIEAAFMAPLQPVSRACAVQQVQQSDDVLAQCRQIAEAFRHADTVLFQGYGDGLALRLWPEGSAERAAIIAERRGLDYGMDLMTRNAATLNSPQATRTLAGLFAKYPTEQTAVRALCVHMGLNPDPPQGWADPTPGG